MTHDYIKREIPTEISEAGGAMALLANKTTTGLDSSLKEAQDGIYVMGNAELVRSNFMGLMKSMAEGVQRDGHSRQLGDFLTMYAQPNGPFDLEKGWDPLVNSISLKVRLLNEMEIDISGWTFRDVTPGRVPFSIDSVSTGDEKGVVAIGEAIHVNGRNLPATDKIRVEWAVEGTAKSGTVAAAKVTADATRADIAGDVLEELRSMTYDGKTIVFTFRGNFCKATARATLKVVPLEATLTSITSTGTVTPDRVYRNATTLLNGTNLVLVNGDNLTASYVHEGQSFSKTIQASQMYPSTDGSFIRINMGDICPNLTDANAGETVTFVLKVQGGIVGAPFQTLTHTAEAMEDPT